MDKLLAMLKEKQWESKANSRQISNDEEEIITETSDGDQTELN